MNWLWPNVEVLSQNFPGRIAVNYIKLCQDSQAPG
jgi:hypothetical protein